MNERIFAEALIDMAIPSPVEQEYEFAQNTIHDGDLKQIIEFFGKPRKWRFDYAIPEHKIAIEIEGGHWSGGRHNTGAGFVKDMEKYNAAAMLGWRVIRCTRSKKSMTQALDFVSACVKKGKNVV